MYKIKRNNPLNIRYSCNNKWVGQIGEDSGFCVFESLAYGFRAAFILLCNYKKQGFDTVEKIITKFAPPCENPTYHYIKFVADKLENIGIHCYGVDMEFRPLSMDNECIVSLLSAMCRFETGVSVSREEIRGYLLSVGVLL